MSSNQTTAKEFEWAWHPPLPLKGVPVFIWPPQPLNALKYLVSLSFMGGILLPFLATAIFTWVYLQPALERCVKFDPDWILQMYARNLALMFLVSGGLHLYFYTFKQQGKTRKFDLRDLYRDNRKFFIRNQTWDNIFWSCASGVTIWTIYEVFFMWAYANNFLPFYLDWKTHPVWFVLMLVAIPFWTSVHFYFIHRLLHWKPLYKVAHAVHHRNDNIGPWSGISMHPIEHIIYFSSVLIHVLLTSHPVHFLFHMHWNALGAAVTHTGFEALTFRNKPILILGSFHHQLHHRFYNCNYGNLPVPWDKWFGSDHDGTPEAWAKIRRHRSNRQSIAKQK